MRTASPGVQALVLSRGLLDRGLEARLEDRQKTRAAALRTKFQSARTVKLLDKKSAFYGRIDDRIASLLVGLPITELDFSGLSTVNANRLGKEQWGPLATPTQLETLNLGGGRKIASAGVLRGLSSMTSVKSLDLWSCGNVSNSDIAHVTSSTNLTHLKLGRRVKLEDMFILSGLTALCHLEVRCMKGPWRASETLSHLTGLATLHMGDQWSNQWDACPALTGLSNLKTRCCMFPHGQSASNLHYLPALGLTRLEVWWRHLAYNSIRQREEWGFHLLPALTTLKELSVITKEIPKAFWHAVSEGTTVTSLEVREVQGCYIRGNQDVLGGMGHLKALVIHMDQMDPVPLDAVVQLTSLIFLSVHSVSRIPAGIAKLTSLHHLDVFLNTFADIEHSLDEIGQMTCLRSLGLGRNFGPGRDAYGRCIDTILKGLFRLFAAKLTYFKFPGTPSGGGLTEVARQVAEEHPQLFLDV